MKIRTCICCKQLFHHNSYSIQCSLCHEWPHLTCTELSKDDIKGKTTSWKCNNCCFRPATSRVSVVSLSEGSQNLVADATSQSGREPESDIAADPRPNFSQTANNPTHNDTETTPDGDRQGPKFWNNFPPSARDKFSNIYLEVVQWKPKFSRLNK